MIHDVPDRTVFLLCLEFFSRFSGGISMRMLSDADLKYIHEMKYGIAPYALKVGGDYLFLHGVFLS